MEDERTRRWGDGFAPLVLVILALAVLSVAAVSFFFHKGYLLYYGDAEAHLNIARRILDSRTPGPGQIGTVWLPLPHLLMAPFAANDHLWRTGLAGSIPSAICYVLAGVFLFATVRRTFGSLAAAVAATGLFALNPNLLYLQSIPMTEPVFYAALMGMLYFSVRFRETQSLLSVVGAALACLAGTLTRYEGWFLIPFLTLYFLLTAKRRRLPAALLFGAVASLGPLSWLAHNWWYYGDALAFYRGPYSALAIQGNSSYPGKGNWREAAQYYRTAASLCMGPVLGWIAVAGIVAAWTRRAWWPLLFLALPGAFYIWSMHSSGTPIFVPTLWPHSYYNTRYGLELLPLASFASAALVTWIPMRWKGAGAAALLILVSLQWLIHPHVDSWITWKESEVNSEARRAWTREAVEYLEPRYRSGSGIFTSFGDLMGIVRTMGVPIRETLTGDNGPQWLMTRVQPRLFLWEEWAISEGGDKVQTTIDRADRHGPYYQLEKRIIVKGAPVIKIYRRAHEPDLP